MVLTTTTDSAAEEWSCTRCSRRMTIRWSPSFEKVVLDRGDEMAPHTGGKGGLAVRGVAAEPVPQRPTEDEHAWLSGLGIAWEDRYAS